VDASSEAVVSLAIVRDANDDIAPAAPPSPLLGLHQFERRAVTGLVAGPAQDIARYTAERATAYASGDADVRRRALARAAAVQDVVAQELTALLSAALARRDTAGAAILDRALNSTNARFLRLLEALRIESAPTRRVVMKATGAIAVTAEERA
jgi:hypothetical protein